MSNKTHQAYKRGLFGYKYIIMVSEAMQINDLVADQQSMTVMVGALEVRTGSTASVYPAMAYPIAYRARNFAASTYYYGIFGPFAYDSVLAYVVALKEYRVDCSNSNPSISRCVSCPVCRRMLFAFALFCVCMCGIVWLPFVCASTHMILFLF